LQAIQEQFLSMLPVSNESVTREEFINYYDDANINFAHNDVFFRYVSNQWHYTSEKKAVVKEEQIKILTKALRFRLIEKSQGTKDELLVRKLFQEYDKNDHFYLTSNDTSQMIKSFKL
jgi:Ca2+-binding EF-hand superfamily protein